MAFEMVMNAARGIGMTTLIMHFLAGGILLAVLGTPFAYQMHTTGNDKGLALGITLWIVVGLFNLGTVMTYWPLQLAISLNEAKLLEVHRSLGSNESRLVAGSVGLFKFNEVRKLPNGNTWFIVGSNRGGDTGLVYYAESDLSGINEWSNVRINPRWSVIEED